MLPAILQLRIGPMMNFAYLLGDGSVNACAVIDPGWDADALLTAASQKNWTIDKILLTHTHFDHVDAVQELVAKTGARVFAHREEAESLPREWDVTPTEEGFVIRVGSLEVRCLHTPGHTPGSQCFLADNALFTGDTLFVDACGRVDLPGSDPRKMIVSLARLAALDPAVLVYPGHDYGGVPSATIGALLEINSCLRATSEETLL
jgi:glyoxylase-like metal-dependent hydrolase (beta-lactamase superfamily II)